MRQWQVMRDARDVAKVADREALLAQTFVEVADTLVDEFDVVEFLSGLATRCVELFETVEAGLMVAEAPGLGAGGRVVESPDAPARALRGATRPRSVPRLLPHRVAVDCADLSTAIDRWPNFAPEALAAGFSSVHALPMRLRNEVIGSLNLLRPPARAASTPPTSPRPRRSPTSRPSASCSTARGRGAMLAEQLQYALNSRVTIEQAKGVLSERSGLDAGDRVRGAAPLRAQPQPAAGGRRHRRRGPHPRRRGDHPAPAAGAHGPTTPPPGARQGLT